MFGIQILVTGGQGFVVNNESVTINRGLLNVLDVTEGPCYWQGPVALAWARQRYQRFIADWDARAWSWPCSMQDYRGEILDACGKAVRDCGGDPAIDRAIVRNQNRT